MRWALRIQSYDFELEYRKGKNNITADCLSRSIEVIMNLSVDQEYDELASDILVDPVKYNDYRVIDGRIWRYVKRKNRQSDHRF